MEYPLEKYKRFIEDVEKSQFFDKHHIRHCEPRRSRDEAISKTGSGQAPQSPNVIARIVKSGEDFSIRYTYEGFNRIYEISDDPRLYYRLRRISSRNLLTHKILKEVIKYQRRYLETADPIDLVPLSQVQLLLDSSWTSRLVSRLSIITPFGEEKPLKWFFSTQRDINKRLIRKLFDGEQEPEHREQKTDAEIRDLLKEKFGVSVSRRTICYCRKELGIPSYRKRLLGDGYSAFTASFSQTYPLTFGIVAKCAPPKSGVYEFSVKNNKRNTIHDTRTTVFYIGSAKDIRKRLKGHLGQNRNNGIKEIIKKYDCFFRYILFPRGWRREEKRLYELFIQTYKAAPKCNKVRPGGSR